MVKNGYGGRSTGTSAVPQIADDFDAPRKSAEVGQILTWLRIDLPSMIRFGTYSTICFTDGDDMAHRGLTRRCAVCEGSAPAGAVLHCCRWP